MFTRDPRSRVFTIEGVQGLQMLENNTTHFGARERRRRRGAGKIGIDCAEYPWRALGRAPDHYSVCAREIKYLARFVRAADVAVCEYRQRHLRFDLANRVELSGAPEEIGACAPVHGQSGDAAALGDACNSRAVFLIRIPTGADLERHRH